MMEYRVKKLLPVGMGWLIYATSCMSSSAADCNKNWEHPVSQQVEMRGMSLTLEEYANEERHFSIRRANHVLEMYFLQDALLIKGPSASEIERYSEEELSWFPMAFSIPNTVLGIVSPKGPCSIKNKARFSRLLSGTLRFGDHKLIHADGLVTQAGSKGISYQFEAKISPPLGGVTSIFYSGSMRFSQLLQPLAPTTNLTGYTLVGSARPLPVIGDATLRISTLGELRVMLERRIPLQQNDQFAEEELRF